MWIGAIMFLSFTLVSSASLASQAVVDESQVVLIANYQASFRAGPEARQMKAQAKVRDRHQFPIQFDDFRILVLPIQLSPSEYRADIVIERLETSTWVPINTEALSLRSSFAAPTELEWDDGEYSLNLAIAVSVLSE